MIEKLEFIKQVNLHTDKVLDITASDHIAGFDINYHNDLLHYLNNRPENVIVRSEYIFNDIIKNKYPNIKFIFDLNTHNSLVGSLLEYIIHPEIKFNNFVCSFNGSNHVSRQLLTAILNNQKIFDPEFSSKNFSYDNDWILGQLDCLELNSDEIELYSHFFKNDSYFTNQIYSFGHVRFDHKNNIYNLEDKLTQSLLHLVSETMATSYYPYFGEKFFYSVVTRGLFVSYANPNWHQHLEKYYGFKKYDKIFDYAFDSIKNPVKRLIRLVEMISKFKNLSVDDWRDLYLMEQDTIEYNYDHYFSKNYLKHLAQFE